jgi:hypothetical protein
LIRSIVHNLVVHPASGVSMRHLSTRRLAALFAVLCLAVFASSAVAASDPISSIVRDVAADGHVDGHYTSAQLRAALNSPLLAQYGGSGGVAGVQAALTHNTQPGTGRSGQLPFTGADIALFLAVGGVLVVAGVALRRLGRNTPPAS